MLRIGLMITLLSLVAGCGGEQGRQAEAEVDVTGTVTMSDGKPAKDLTVRFFAGSAGTTGTTAAVKDGKFTVKLRPGSYTYAIEGKTPAALKGVPMKYQDNHPDNAATVKAAGDTIVIDLK